MRTTNLIKNQHLFQKLIVVFAILGLLVNVFSVPIAAFATDTTPATSGIDNMHYQAVDKKGQSVPNATVQIVALSGQRVKYNLTADDQGNFTTAYDVTAKQPATHINPGRYQLTADTSPTGYQLELSAQIIEVAENDLNSGQVTYVDTNPTGKLTLTATDQAKQPLADILMTATNQTTNKSYQLPVTGVDGQTTMALPVGQYQIQVNTAQGYQLKTTMQTMAVTEETPVSQAIQFEQQVGAIQTTLKDQSTQKPIAGAQFEAIALQNDQQTVTGTTDENGQVSWSNLPIGEYQIQPAGQIAGYSATVPASQKVTVTAQKTTENLFLAYEQTSGLHLSSISASGQPIPNVDYRIEATDGSTSQDVKTDANGQATVNDLRIGRYRVTEKSVPAGYQLTSQTQHVTLTDQTTQTVTFKHRVVKTDTRHKCVLQATDYQGKALSGVQFKVELIDSVESVVKNVTTGANGAVTLANLPVGQYRITQVAAPEGYQVAPTARTVTIDNQSVNEFTQRLKRAVGPVTFKVVDQTTRHPLAGARVKIKTVVASGTGQTTFLSGKTDSNGLVTVNRVPVGKLTYQQVTTAENYVVDSQIHGATLRTEGQQFILTNQAVQPVTTGQITVNKTDMQGFSLDQAQFKLTNLTDGTTQVQTTQAGQVRFTGLAAGQYQIQETKAPAGYQLATETKTVTVDPRQRQNHVVNFADQRTTVAPTNPLTIQTTNTDGQSVAGAVFKVTTNQADDQGQDTWVLTADQNGLIVLPNAVTGQYRITEIKAPKGYQLNATVYRLHVTTYGYNQLSISHESTIVPHDLRIVKTDLQEQRLAGATFMVESVQTGQTQKVTTNQHGIATAANLATGQYRVQEVVAPTGYRLDATSHQITINGKMDQQLRIQDTPEAGQLTVINTNQAGDRLTGAQFDLKDQLGQFIGNYKTDAEGQLKVAELTPGTYTVQETQVADGYQLNAKTFKITVTDQTTTKLNVIDQKQATTTETGILVLSNSDAKLKTALVGATFRIETATGQTVKKQVVIDQNGQAVMPKLVAGQYRLIQTTAATAYQIAPTQTFEITANQMTKVTVTNEQRPGSVIVNQVDGNTNQPLAGAKFELQDRLGNVLITNLKSDSRGQVIMSYLTPAVYQLVEVTAPEGYGLIEKPVVFRITGSDVRLK